jgi:hypothetical protein
MNRLFRGPALLIGSAATVAGMAVGGTLLADHAASNPTSVDSVHPVTAQAASATAASQPLHPRPRYLPAGAKLVRQGAIPQAPSAWIEQYSLPGIANKDTESSRTDFEPSDVSVHPASTLRLVVAAKTAGLHPPIGAGFTTQPVEVGGSSGTLIEPVAGYGGYVVTWSRGGCDYILGVDRLKVEHGPSGVSVGELEKVAASIR